MKAWRRITAFVMVLMMLMTIAPGSVASDTEGYDVMPVLDVSDMEPEVPAEGADVPEAVDPEYSNEADISPNSIGKDDILQALDSHGYIYLSTSGSEFIVYADSGREKEACKVVKEGSSILLADGFENDMIHIRFIDQDGSAQEGFIGIGSFTILTDKEAGETAEAFGITSSKKDGFALYATEVQTVLLA